MWKTQLTLYLFLSQYWGKSLEPWWVYWASPSLRYLPVSSVRDLLLKNLADANGNAADEQFVVEMFPKNRPYGCCINRGSKVTIVCSRGFSRVGIGWYGYYLSKLGGFNDVCKSIEVDLGLPREVTL